MHLSVQFSFLLLLTEVGVFLAEQDPNRNQGYAESVYLDAKFECSSFERSLFSVASEIQCHHRCLKDEQCTLLNYRQSRALDGNTDNCEVYAVAGQESSCQSVKGMTGWKAIVFKRVNITLPPIEYEDCRDAFRKNTAPVSGVYNLKHGKHYCVMETLAGCGEGGWTLALKMNGSLNTFEFSSLLWGNDDNYNVEEGLKSFTSSEAKFPAYRLQNFEKICIGMYDNNITRWAGLSLNDTFLSSNVSLQDIFKSETFVPTAVGQSGWRGLSLGSSLQSYCNREGFNVKGDGNELKIRLGLVANQEANCLTPESYIGLGSTMVALCNPAIEPISCGNFAACFADNGDKSLPVMGMLLIK